MRDMLVEIAKESDIETVPEAENYVGFAQPYFLLAKAEYRAGRKENAATHFLKAMECGYARNTGGDATTGYLDTLLLEYPAAELYVARGLAYYGRAPYLGWGDATKACFAQAIRDFEQAERTGFSDYRINLYKAEALNQYKKYDEALREINIAIAKNPNEPRNFGTRYSIRTNLGQTRWGDKNDPDIVQQEQLRSIKK